MTDSTATESPALHSISFTINADPDEGTTVLIDGLPLEVQSRRGFLGFLPRELFSAQLPLVPVYPPRRVPIARCSCGVVGCGNIAPVTSYGGADEELVIWSDFRDAGSAAYSPSEINADIAFDDRSKLDQDDLAFDRVQYETAVLAASVDRGWEAPGEATARLLVGMLSTDAAVLRSLGLVLTWVTPSERRPRSWTIALAVPHPHRTAAQRRADSLREVAEQPKPDPLGQRRGWRMGSSRLRLRPWEHEPRQVLLELTTAPAAPAQQAADLYRQLTDHPLTDWERAFPWSGYRGQ